MMPDIKIETSVPSNEKPRPECVDCGRTIPFVQGTTRTIAGTMVERGWVCEPCFWDNGVRDMLD